jgi:hypothetical protein
MLLIVKPNAGPFTLMGKNTVAGESGGFASMGPPAGTVSTRPITPADLAAGSSFGKAWLLLTGTFLALSPENCPKRT